MKIGYIRVSRDKQTTALQEDAMNKEHCERVFTDKMSGKRFDRPEFLKMLDVARTGDVIVIWRLDRLEYVLKIAEAAWRGASAGFLVLQP
jgi:DNA invertase Pin-like site-specific DNA recombinase